MSGLFDLCLPVRYAPPVKERLLLDGKFYAKL